MRQPGVSINVEHSPLTIAVLIENGGRGEPTQAILYYPANYQPGRQYPMVVYIYERLTNGLHQYTAPSDRQQYNTTNFVQPASAQFRAMQDAALGLLW